MSSLWFSMAYVVQMGSLIYPSYINHKSWAHWSRFTMHAGFSLSVRFSEARGGGEGGSNWFGVSPDSQYWKQSSIGRSSPAGDGSVSYFAARDRKQPTKWRVLSTVYGSEWTSSACVFPELYISSVILLYQQSYVFITVSCVIACRCLLVEMI